MLTDNIADFLTRIRNAQRAKQRYTDVRKSKMNIAILKVLKEKRFIQEYDLQKTKLDVRVLLKYDARQKPLIKYIQRESRQGKRIYTSAANIPVVLKGIGFCVISTSHGIIDGYKAREKGIGGEILCTVY